MSDPMTNTEVEDVLASIRRLVSDDDRLETEKKKSEPADRLVLTPALRVTEESETEGSESAVDLSEQPDAAEIEDQQDVSPPDALDDAPVDDVHEGAEDDPVAFEFKHVGSARAKEQSKDVKGHVDEASDPDQDTPPIALDTVDLDQDTLLSVRDAFADGQDWDAAQNQQGATEDTNASSLSAKIAALETLIAGQTEEFEPERAGDGANAGTDAPAMEWDEPDATERKEPFETDAQVIADHEPSEMVSDADPASLNSEPLENQVAEVETQAELTEPEQDVSDWQSEQQTDNATTSSYDDEYADTDPFEDDGSVLTADADLLDEEALRDLVSTIVREELQGALGERITRNVRKLVRREIHRALAAQDLE